MTEDVVKNKGGRPRKKPWTPPVRKYEYMSLPSHKANDTRLNELGNEGWLLVGVDQGYVYLMKDK